MAFHFARSTADVKNPRDIHVVDLPAGVTRCVLLARWGQGFGKLMNLVLHGWRRQNQTYPAQAFSGVEHSYEDKSDQERTRIRDPHVGGAVPLSTMMVVERKKGGELREIKDTVHFIGYRDSSLVSGQCHLLDHGWCT